MQPDVLLMDEPCSALDPISMLAVEDLINELKDEYTIVILTHNMQQAARASESPSPEDGDDKALHRAATSRPAARRPARIAGYIEHTPVGLADPRCAATISFCICVLLLLILQGTRVAVNALIRSSDTPPRGLSGG